MTEMVHFLVRHGYWLLIGVVVARQACLPVPANLFLVAAGALTRLGKLNAFGVIGYAVMTFLVADLAWYEAGRRFGERILHLVCGLSRDPDACALKATNLFSNHRRRTLLLSKFVIGLDAISAPMAGAARLNRAEFLAFDAAAATLWSGVYLALGYIFSSQLDRVAVHIARVGTVLAICCATAFGLYVGYRFANWRIFVRQFNLARITPEQLRDKMEAGENVLVVDVQAGSNAASPRMAIPGAFRVNSQRLESCKDLKIAGTREVVLYCDCPGEFTSARVALALRRKGVEHVRPLEGGLRAWRQRGFPVTSGVEVPVLGLLHQQIPLK